MGQNGNMGGIGLDIVGGDNRGQIKQGAGII